ncbi:MAG TPA: PAS domain S-box protein [Gemmatimonadaceae bacterium]|nr:PAS domain S-box protein [Gemmatimonadaceae bacterium]
MSESFSSFESVTTPSPLRDADILLSRLQVASMSLTRAEGEREIVETLGRGALGLLDGDGVIVADPQLDRGTLRLLVHHARGVDAESQILPAGDGVIVQCGRSGEPVLITDSEDAALLHPIVDAARGGIARSLACAPLTHGRRLYGVVAVYSAQARAFDERDLDVLRTFGALAATLLSNTRLYTESERERRQSDALAEIARAVGESLRMGEVLRLILRHSMSLLGVEGAYVALVRDEYLHIVSSLGSGDLLSGLHLPVRTTLDGKAVREGSAIIANEARAHPGAYRPAYEVTTIEKVLTVPLVTVRGTIGVLTVFNRQAPFTDDDARVLRRLADQVAVAIVNARLFEEVSEAGREWSATFDAIGVGMVVVDDGGAILRYNSRAVQLSGLETPRELAGRSFYEAVLHEDRAGDEKAPLARVAREGRMVRATLASTVRGRVFDVTAAPHPNGGAIVTFDDITATRALSERNRLVVESAVDALLIADPDGVITFANRAAHELLSREELVGNAFSELVIPETSEEVHSHIQLAAESNSSLTSQRREYLVVRGDGERRVAAVSLAPLREADRTTGVVIAMRDVTEERRARDAVSQTEARYRNLFDTVNDALFTLDARGAVTSANQAACQMLDAAQEELLGRSIVPYLDSDDIDRVTAYARDALAGVVRRFECRAARRSGLRRLLSVTMTPLRQGRVVVGALCVARDVSEERSRANAVAEVEARLEQLVEITSDGICTVDEEGNITSANAAFERAIGRVRDAVLGDHFTVFVDPRDRDAVWGIFVGALHGVRQHGDVRYIAASGESRWAHVIAAPLLIQGRVGGALAVLRDITEDRALRERVARFERDRGTPLSPPTIDAVPEEAPAQSGVSLAVLVVDDEAAIRTAVARYLSSLGHIVDVAASGREALDRLANRSFDLILLDLRMPDIAGDALYRELVVRDASHAGRIVFVTGEDATAPDTHAFLQASGRPVIGKPFSLDDLRRALALATL